jgi:anti-sigma regulatory factor (Ser/Thr protein kinase)
VRVGVALHEALRNAIHHGNLELSSQLRHAEPEAYYHLAAQRQRQEPYCARRVYLQAREARDESQYIIRDEGSGFNVSQLDYDPTNHGNLHIPSGRGLFLIRTFMDEVRFNSLGNEITMIHRRNTRGGQTDSALAV